MKKIDEIFLKLKIKKELGRFLLKILQRSVKDFYWRSFEDLNKIQVENLWKISKRFSGETLWRSFEENKCRSFEDSSKIFRRKGFNQKSS